MGWLLNLISNLGYSLAHSLGWQWLNRQMYGDSQERMDEMNVRTQRRYRQIALCKQALLAAHPVHELRRYAGVLRPKQATDVRHECRQLGRSVREVLMGVYLESDMDALRQAMEAFGQAVERYETAVKDNQPAPNFDELQARFESLVNAGRREIARLEGLAPSGNSDP